MIDQSCNFGLALTFPIFTFAQRTWISKIAWKYSFSLSFDIRRSNTFVKKSVFSYLWFQTIKLKYNNSSTFLIIIGKKDYFEIINTLHKTTIKNLIESIFIYFHLNSINQYQIVYNTTKF